MMQEGILCLLINWVVASEGLINNILDLRLG